MRRIFEALFLAAAVSACHGKPGGEALQAGSDPQNAGPARIDPASPAIEPIKAPAAREIAIYKVSGLDEEAVETLVGALSDQGGVISAQGDVKSGVFSVTFEPGKASPADMTKKLAAVSPGIVLDRVEAQAADSQVPKHECGGCPMQNVCGGQH